MHVVFRVLAFWGMLWVGVTPLLSQTCTLYGYLRTQGSLEPIVGASVYLSDMSAGVLTNAQGYYALPLRCGVQVELVLQCLGYESDTIRLGLQRDSLLNRTLAPFALETVEVVARAPERALGYRQFSMQQLSRIPVMLGEPDPMKALALLPGVAQGQEGTVGLHVRGGSVDQNLILLDGSPVYNNGHLFGFVSVFHPASIKTIDLHKGYFPARYGGRLSSVMDITMKDGNRQERKREASLGLISSSLSDEGPLGGGKGSYLLSGRAAHSGLLTLASLPGYAGSQPLVFAGMYDFNGKLTYTFPDAGKLSVSVYAGDDFFGSTVRTGEERGTSILRWGNKTFALRHTKALNARVYSETYFNYNRFDNNILLRQRLAEDNNRLAKLKNTSYIREWSLRQTLHWTQNRGEFRAGGQLTSHAFQPVRLSGQSSETQLVEAGERYLPWSGGLYAEQMIRLGSVQVSGGLRWAGYVLGQEQFSALEPRAQVSFGRSGYGQWQLSYSRMTQFLHLVTMGGAGLPYDYWLPVTARTPPQKADVFSSGWQRNVQSWFFSVEGFYKRMEQQVDLVSGLSILGGPGTAWEESLHRGGDGQAYGVEVLVEKKSGRLSGWLGYTWSRSLRRFAEINGGAWFPYNFDRPHDIGLTLQYAAGRRWALSSNFIYQTGRPVTLPEGVITNAFGRQTLLYLTRNNARLPDYHRLDIQLTKSYTTRRRGRDAMIAFGVYNLYGRPNVLFADLQGWGNPVPGSPDRWSATISYFTLFRFIPSFNYTVKW